MAQTHALVFKDRPDYRFVLGEKAKCWISSRNRVALPTRRRVDDRRQHLCPRSARQARLRRYNVHTGFDPANTEQLAALLKTHDVHVDPTEVLTPRGSASCAGTGRSADRFPRQPIRRFQSFAEISTEPGLHFGLRLEAYATDLADP